MKIDKKRILTKIDELNGYMEELEKIKPASFSEYKSEIGKKRACERLLQISVECVIDICNIIVSNLQLGLPSEEEELFEKLEKDKIISPGLRKTLTKMKGLRNILVHKYGEIDDELVFEALGDLLDFNKFKEEILKSLKKH